MAPLEPWEKVFVSEEFLTSVHGTASCTSCHGGNAVADMEQAHEGLIADPAVDGKEACGSCHAEEVEKYGTSLHATQSGYWETFNVRSKMPDNEEALTEMFNNHCGTCHTSCGECHISQPNNVGGGLLNGHVFEKTPPMTRTCTACHGSRVGNEYMGKNEDLVGDVHFRQGRMKCTDCHTGESLHDSNGQVRRYDGEQGPACESCHAEVGAEGDENSHHTIHKDKLSCQVCHSIAYSNCDSCHVSISDKTGNPMFKTAGTYFTFMIGKNPLKSEARPYDYVPVRHIPIDPENYAFYGENLLPNFNAWPTWMYATPHNIQLKTPQTEACANCHGNPELFLTADKVKPEELEANKPVIVEEIPKKLGN